MNLALSVGAGAGYGGVWEYASAVDAAGRPTAWTALRVLSNTTSGLKTSGRVTFDPPVTEIPKPRNTDAVTPTWFDRSKSAAVAFTWATWTRSEFRTVIPATPSAVFTYSAWASVTFAR